MEDLTVSDLILCSNLLTKESKRLSEIGNTTLANDRARLANKIQDLVEFKGKKGKV